MRLQMRWTVCALIVAAIFGSLIAGSSSAASINYGNFVVPGATFVSVTESSGSDPVPLYGPPDAFPVGLDFDPIGFVATGSNGAADITEGQLNFTFSGNVVGDTVNAIDSLSLFEAGDYSLAGVGTAATTATAGAIMRLTVTEVDGVPITPLSLIPVNASVGFNLAANPGIVQPWSLGLSANIKAQLMSAAIPFIAGATKVEVVIDNSLVAISQPSTVSFIAKKDFRVEAETEPIRIPEPGTLVLGALGLCALAGRRRVIA